MYVLAGKVNNVVDKLITAKEERASVPCTLKQDEVEPFLRDVMTRSEPWNSLKLIILGHGRIGKTTLLHSIKDILQLRNKIV